MFSSVQPCSVRISRQTANWRGRFSIRAISVSDLNELRIWVDTRSPVPEGGWYKSYPKTEPPFASAGIPSNLQVAKLAEIDILAVLKDSDRIALHIADADLEASRIQTARDTPLAGPIR